MSSSLSLTNRRSLRHTFGELSDTVNMPNLIAIQRFSYQQFLDSKVDINNDKLYTYNWPGNVRELRNLIERITILSANETKGNTNKLIEDILDPSISIDLNENFIEKSFSSPLKEARKHFEKEYLITQIKKNHGNISKTADFIGMERSALHRKLKELGIKGIN